MSLEDLTPEQQDQAARLFKFVKANPKVEKDIRRAAKAQNPNMSAPDLEIEDAIAAQKAESDAKIKELQDANLETLRNQRRAEAHAKCRAAGFEPDAVEKIMVDESIGNYDTAINYMRGQKVMAPATFESISPHSLPNNKDLWADKNGFARRAAHDAMNDIRQGKVTLGGAR
jgi:hypothetical protein